MKIDKYTELSLMIDADIDMQHQITSEQADVVKKRISDDSKRDVDFSIMNSIRLVNNLEHDEGYVNKNYLIRETAMDMVKQIPLTEKFDIRYLKNLRQTKASFLLGKEQCLRFYNTDDAVHGVFFIHKNDRLNWVFFKIDLNTGEVILPTVNRENEFTGEDVQWEVETNWRSDETFILFIQLVMFIMLSDVEIDVLEPNRKIGTRKTGKYFNQSTENVCIVDSKWNTVSVRTEGFKVNGHWRMQPHGKNREQRRLTWIDSFEKNGYIRNKSKLARA